jgi:Fe(3+) dicitrate transport protein
MNRRSVTRVACALALSLAASPALAQAEPETEAGAETEDESEAESEAGSESEAEAEGGTEDEDLDDEGGSLRLSDVTVAGAAEEAFEAGGSVHVIGEEELGVLNYDDPNAVLARVAGVYVRQEDGFGLRPNIGLRGASSERSRKVTLMEDGVLMAPAPYAAPAGYYFPLMTRITGVEVSLGPAAILYGPHTVGGAVNLIGRQIPASRGGQLDLALGTTWLGRFHAHYGDSNRWGGFLAEVLHVRSDGFRTFDWAQHDSGTGFDRTDVLLRGDLHGDLTEDVYHRLELTLGLGLEGSNETYLGLADADLRASPWRRYGASSTDRMEWWRTRAQLRYELEIGEDVDVTVTAYRHDLDRTWQRLDGFADGTSLYEVLQSPTGRNAVYYEALTQTGPGDPSLALLRVRNARRFVSQGVQAQSRIRFRTEPFAHDLTIGARLHYDEIERNHTGDTLYVSDRALVPVGQQGRLLEENRAQALAFSAWAAWRVQVGRLSLTPGLRTELIWTEALDRQTGVIVWGQQRALLPGLGIQYEVTDPLAVFAGVHQGYSPIAPGQPAEVRPEQSVNWEIGARYGRADEPSNGQASFFYSDYQNLTGDCSGAGGCNIEMVDRQFNAGNVSVLGVEAQLAHTFEIDEVSIPVRGTYTWTYSRFRSSFTSDNPQWGTVREGDHLPYVPEHQGSAQVGLAWRMLRVDVTGAFVAPMRDRAGQGASLPTDWTDTQAMIDAVARVEILDGVSVYVRGENLTNAAPIVSRRPFGARVSRPFMLQGGLEVALP